MVYLSHYILINQQVTVLWFWVMNRAEIAPPSGCVVVGNGPIVSAMKVGALDSGYWIIAIVFHHLVLSHDTVSWFRGSNQESYLQKLEQIYCKWGSASHMVMPRLGQAKWNCPQVATRLLVSWPHPFDSTPGTSRTIYPCYHVLSNVLWFCDCFV